MFINDEAQRQVLPILAKTGVTPATESQQRAGPLLQMNPGQQVKAEIIANLPNNLYLARVAGELYKLEIPLNVQPGETLEMTFVTAEPRITFEIPRQGGGGAAVRLSSLGRWLSDVAKNAPPLARGEELLLEDPAQGAALLAGRLKEAITQGGLFYEAHLAQWAAGGLQLAEILKEPQGKLSRLAAKEKAAQGGEPAAAEVADRSTLPLIKEQLLLLNSGVLSWKGTAWPGQGMEISVGERELEEGESGCEATLALRLPHLGGVKATLGCGAQGLTVNFSCEEPGSAALLRSGGDRLRAALSSSGVQLKRMAVRDEEAV